MAHDQTGPQEAGQQAEESPIVQLVKHFDRMTFEERRQLVQTADDIRAYGGGIAGRRLAERTEGSDVLQGDGAEIRINRSELKWGVEYVVVPADEFGKLRAIAKEFHHQRERDTSDSVPTLKPGSHFRASDRMWAVKTIDRHTEKDEWDELTIEAYRPVKGGFEHCDPQWDRQERDAFERGERD